MNYLKRLSKIYNNSEKIIIDNNSKFIIMSDVHRGDMYIELGDGDELWENRNLNDINT